MGVNRQVGDKAIEIVSEMANLCFLEFRATAVSDKSVDDIRKLQFLELISMSQSRMTEAGKPML